MRLRSAAYERRAFDDGGRVVLVCVPPQRENQQTFDADDKSFPILVSACGSKLKILGRG